MPVVEPAPSQKHFDLQDSGLESMDHRSVTEQPPAVTHTKLYQDKVHSTAAHEQKSLQDILSLSLQTKFQIQRLYIY